MSAFVYTRARQGSPVVEIVLKLWSGTQVDGGAAAAGDCS